jgi:hypothetical protein
MNELELVAIWLNGAALELGRKDDFRKIIRLAAVHADEMYTPEDESYHDPLGVRAVIAAFAAAVDQDDRDRKDGDE